MTSRALLIRLDARTGQEKEVEALLRSVEPVAGESVAAHCWFALRTAPEIYALFCTFESDSDRDAYLSVLEPVWAERTSELLSRPPVIEKVEVLRAHPNTPASMAASHNPDNSLEPPRSRTVPEVPKVGSQDAPGG